MQPAGGEFGAMNNLNALLNQHQISSLNELHTHGQLPQMLAASQFDPVASHDDFLEQMLSSPAAAAYPWADDHWQMEEQSAAVLASKLRQHQISSGAAKAFMLQQQLLLSRGLAAGNGGPRSPTGSDGALLPMPQGDRNDGVDGNGFKSIQATDASIKDIFNGFTGSLGQTSNQSQHFHHPQLLCQVQNLGPAGTATPSGAAQAMNQPALSGSSGGEASGQPRQRVRARRGQATDPHSIAERLRRERIAERMKALQELVPNANKTDKASMLDEIITYVKFLQLQVKVLSMSRLGGASAVAPLVADMSSEGRSGNGTQTVSSSNNEGMTVTEHQVAKLMEEDMGSAMQYLQGKGLCLMPISLATAISTGTSHSRNPLAAANSLKINGNPLLNSDARGPTSPSISVLTVQSAAMGGNVNGEPSLKDVSKP